MELQNDTPVRAVLLPFRERDGRVTSALVVKSTYDLSPGGDLSLSAAADQMPILGDPHRTAFGWFHTDVFPRKEGVDIGVLGTVRRRDPVTSALLRLTVGKLQHGLRVTGDRVWSRRALTGTLEPSAPRPFTEMPVTYSRAFGARGSVDPHRAAWPDNPEGAGYYAEAAHAEGQPLPNIEPSQGPFITSWDDRPPVAGWGPYPMFWGLRKREAVRADPGPGPPKIAEVRFRIWNNAHPALVVPEIAPGETVRAEGLLEEPLSFRMPLAVTRARVRVGLRSFTVSTKVDGVFFWADRGRVVVTERGEIEYDYDPRKRREAILVREGAG